MRIEELEQRLFNDNVKMSKIKKIFDEQQAVVKIMQKQGLEDKANF